MAYYKTCPECGATLDPGEKCDCREMQNVKKPKSARIVNIKKPLSARPTLKAAG